MKRGFGSGVGSVPSLASFGRSRYPLEVRRRTVSPHSKRLYYRVDGLWRNRRTGSTGIRDGDRLIIRMLIVRIRSPPAQTIQRNRQSSLALREFSSLEYGGLTSLSDRPSRRESPTIEHWRNRRTSSDWDDRLFKEPLYYRTLGLGRPSTLSSQPRNRRLIR